MMEMEELERREKIEIHQDAMIKQIAASTRQSAQMLRAMHRGQYVPSNATLAYKQKRKIFTKWQNLTYTIWKMTTVESMQTE